jgi:hypothetical protein
MTTVNNRWRPLFATKVTRVGCILVRFSDGTRLAISKRSCRWSKQAPPCPRKRQFYVRSDEVRLRSADKRRSQRPARSFLVGSGRSLEGEFRVPSPPLPRGIRRGRCGLEPARVHPTGDGDGDRMPTRPLQLPASGFVPGLIADGCQCVKKKGAIGALPPGLRRS